MYENKIKDGCAMCGCRIEEIDATQAEKLKRYTEKGNYCGRCNSECADNAFISLNKENMTEYHKRIDNIGQLLAKYVK